MEIKSQSERTVAFIINDDTELICLTRHQSIELVLTMNLCKMRQQQEAK